MKNFHLIGINLDMVPLQLALIKREDLFGALPLRTGIDESPHKVVQDILLRFSQSRDADVVNADPESPDTPAYKELPEARTLVNWLVARVAAERVGRVMITKLAPGKEITEHTDMGAYAAYYDRFHVVIQSGPGMIFRGEDEEVQMNTGEVWWVANKRSHSVKNGGMVDRLHMIVDLRLRQ